ncbi:hypothetical protein Tco_1371713 [Tanacetum coccineum]
MHSETLVPTTSTNDNHDHDISSNSRSINSLSTTNNSHNHDFDNDTVNKNDQILNEFDHEEIVLVTDPDPDGVTVIENNPPDSFWERTKADVSAPHWSANDWLALGGTKRLSIDQSGADTSTIVSPYHVPLGHTLEKPFF